MAPKKKRVLILGASGFLGQSIYKELAPYFKTFGTYCSSEKKFKSNKHFFNYNFEDDDIVQHLNVLKPDVIISALRGAFAHQLIVHQNLLRKDLFLILIEHLYLHYLRISCHQQ